MRHWLDQRRRYISNWKAVNHSLQCTRKKPLINWVIHDRWQLRWQANSNLDSNHGLRIKWPNERSSRWMNKRRLSKDWVSLCWKQTTYGLELVHCTLLINVKPISIVWCKKRPINEASQTRVKSQTISTYFLWFSTALLVKNIHKEPMENMTRYGTCV